MERAPPPSLAAAALAAMDDALMDTPLSPKRPRQDDPPDQVGEGASAPRPHNAKNSETAACMLAAANMQHTHKRVQLEVPFFFTPPLPFSTPYTILPLSFASLAISPPPKTCP